MKTNFYITDLFGFTEECTLNVNITLTAEKLKGFEPENAPEAESVSIDRLKEPSRGKLYGYIKDYNDDNADSLATCINDFLYFGGHFCERIDFLDFKFSGECRPGYLYCIIRGRTVVVEAMDCNDDTLGLAMYMKKHIEAAGGSYVVVRTFVEFLNWYDRLV